MSTHEPGVTDLLRRASDDLAPDVDRLVRGGITRGRSRHRRARIGTTVATVAVIGVVGGLTAVVAQLGGADSARDLAVAGGGGGVVSKSPSESALLVTPPPDSTTGPAAFAMAAAAIPEAVRALGLLTDVSAPLSEEPYGVIDDSDEKVVHFRINGMLTTFSAIRSRPPGGRRGATVFQTDGPMTLLGVTSQSATVWRAGWKIDVVSYNAAARKDSPTLSPSPALSLEQLAAAAGSDVYFG